MPHRDAPTVRVDDVVCEAQLCLGTGNNSAEGLVNLDQIQVAGRDSLPPERLLAAPGGHDWAPWKTMWADALERVPLPRVQPAVAR